MRLRAALIGKPEPTTAKSGLTSHFKKPVAAPIAVGPNGLDGDTICDTKNHGGVDQAVYLFGKTDRVWWQDHLGRPTPPGFFGENLLISKLCSADLALGDIVRVGNVLLQITSPRIPCATYAAHIGDGQAIKQFYAAERPGAYARVLVAGTLTVGDQVSIEPHQGTRVSIIENMRAFLGGFADDSFLRKALTVPAHHKLHALARQRLGDDDLP